ncbi:hypothetical protein D3C87_1627320 [compost metagenome]
MIPLRRTPEVKSTKAIKIITGFVKIFFNMKPIVGFNSSSSAEEASAVSNSPKFASAGVSFKRIMSIKAQQIKRKAGIVNTNQVAFVVPVSIAKICWMKL